MVWTEGKCSVRGFKTIKREHFDTLKNTAQSKTAQSCSVLKCWFVAMVTLGNLERAASSFYSVISHGSPRSHVGSVFTGQSELKYGQEKYGPFTCKLTFQIGSFIQITHIVWLPPNWLLCNNNQMRQNYSNIWGLASIEHSNSHYNLRSLFHP